MNGWHFTKYPFALRDGEKFALGETLTHKSKIIPCQSGYHASPTVFDALQYAPGHHLYRVTLGGEIIAHGNPVDKYAASERTATGYCDTEPLLRLFTRQCALDVIHLWAAPNVMRQYLLTGDESLRSAAYSAAFAADAAFAASTAVATSAADSAASAASAADVAYATSAADSAAYGQGAVWSAAFAAARESNRAKQSARLDSWTEAYMATGLLPTVEVSA